RNKHRCLWRMAELPARALRQLYDEHRLESMLSGADSHAPVHLELTTTTPRAFPDLARLGVRIVAKVVSKLATTDRWTIAIGTSAPCQSGARCSARFTLLAPPPDGFWADPIAVKCDDGLFIFVEDYVNTEKRGRISVLKIENGMVVDGPMPVLDLPHHL